MLRYDTVCPVMLRKIMFYPQYHAPNMTFHNLRNLSLSYLADQGESGAVLQKHASHKNFSTTARYIGVSTETTDRVTMKLDGLFT